MRILIFGSTGQLGSEWVSWLEKHAADVDIYSFASNEVDITIESRVKEVIRDINPEVLVNCAAYTKVDEAEDQRAKALEVNAGAVDSIARICQQKGVKLIHYSTDYVFRGNKEDKTKYPEGYPEDHRSSPVNWYGETKWRGEMAIRKHKPEHLIFRVSWLCGEHGSNFVTKMLSLSERHDQLDVVDDQFGSPTFARNVVANSWNALKQGENGTFHITSTGLISWFQFAGEIFKITGRDVRVTPVNSEQFITVAKRPAFSKLSTSKLQNIPGSNVINWEEGLKNLLSRLTGVNKDAK